MQIPKEIFMLEESEYVRQVKGEPRRRWFSDDYFDLIVWVDDSNVMLGFQLCYDKAGDPRVLNWHEQGYSHLGIDDGEGRIGKPKSTPILVSGGAFNKAEINDAFKKACDKIDSQVSAFVLEKIKNY
jgi:hypothetical protein